MLRNLLIFILAALAFWYGAEFLTDRQPQGARNEAVVVQQPALEPIIPPPTESPARQFADISLHTPEELDLLFDHVEELLDRPRGEGEAPIISLVLHGPEVEFFALKNYQRYRDIVDRAAKLAALGAVDISICQTQMRQLNLGKDEVPAFLRQVPYGPDEVNLLREQGYVAM
jgi:intracellular sulfur oxidation DsrE/DsrF family protein